jgi:hypothetical protein
MGRYTGEPVHKAVEEGRLSKYERNTYYLHWLSRGNLTKKFSICVPFS